MSQSPEVIVTGALATKVSNIAPMRYTAEAIAGKNAVHYVHGGIVNGQGELSVATPSDQEAQITEIIERNPTKNYIILSQSMGALAALACVEKFYYDNVKAISVAPPLLYPSDVIRHPRITTMSKVQDGKLILPSRSFALGDSGPVYMEPSKLPTPLELTVPTELFEEIDSANAEYWDRTTTAINEGGLRIVMPTEDWNTAALEASQDLPQVQYLKGPHSLITEDATLQHNIKEIARLAQSLRKATGKR